MKPGAIALFGEKYGDRCVWSRRGAPFSTELCGGTHVSATGEIGLFKIVSESSVGSGLRRIEAVTGNARKAASLAASSINAVREIGKLLDTQPQSVVLKVQELTASRDAETKRAEALERQMARVQKGCLRPAQAGGGDRRGAGAGYARQAFAPGNSARHGGCPARAAGQRGGGLGTVNDDKPYFVVTVTQDLVAQGYNAGSIIRQAAAITGGGGGGKPNLAQGGGKDVSKLEDAIAAVPSILNKK